MLKKTLILLFLAVCIQNAWAQVIPFEKNNKLSATYQELVEFYTLLDQKYDQMRVIDYGPTDIGKPLQLIVLSKDKVFDPVLIRKQNKRILLINNGIHPGEPEGIDASMMLVRDLLEKNSIPDNVVICIIPIYNIDGMLNRGLSRVNQNGPEAYGFRGNYQNLDLNRDFIKSDSQNSRSFQKIFTTWQPDVFMDNHTSNGADYQYIMTLIPSQKDKLNSVLSNYLSTKMLPELYTKMKESGYDLTPYVNSMGETPESGIVGFLETPRYSSGYAALHNTIGFIPETHMLKPFDQRVKSTQQFMVHVISTIQKDAVIIGETKRKADEAVKNQELFPLRWTLNTDTFSTFSFKGFEAKYKTSEVSGKSRLYYDRNEPFERDIKVFDDYRPSLTVNKPIAYVIPQAWQKVIELLQLNGVEMKRLRADVALDLEMYYIEDYKNGSTPYEGRYLKSQVKLKAEMRKVNFYEGDYLVFTDQIKNRYIIETLEPQATDSFFAWNFFDSTLGQKEHFSDYVFEDVAAQLLKDDPKLAEDLKLEKLKNLANFSALDWVYRNSKYYEKTHKRYPIGRLVSPIKLDLK
ncbi:M14 family metallopeptidase [Daejeonella sp.]|jgi:hypothetical protein|uniref:M14 family metallopeptidase n=1 Tax=Daejeonella sp. TaxID=2805397 RepID=UPI00378384AC